MSKYELTISTNYARSWTFTDAIRELFQNAIDQEVQEDNVMFFDYANDTLSIGNKSSVLSIRTLLLGETTKHGDDRTIGKFGEGYKIATLVLLRLGKSICFYNYGAKEVWRPRFVNSKRYDAKVLTFFVDKKHVWDKVPDNNLTIEVGGVSQEEYEEVYASNLHLHDVYKKADAMLVTRKGSVLLDERYKGKVFVNGLYVCTHDKYMYGYDFKPAYIKIDRDRKLVSDWDLQWLSSEIWTDVEDDNELLVKLVREDAPDVRYIAKLLEWAFSSKRDTIRDTAYDKFKEEHGDKAIPVSTQDELANTPAGYKPVLVADVYKGLVRASRKYEEPKIVEPVGPVQRLEDLLEAIRHKLTGDEVAVFEDALDELNKE